MLASLKRVCNGTSCYIWMCPTCCVLQGSAGQSFGCFIVAGMETKLVGEANDYVGKGMAGGQISIMPPPESTFNPGESSLVGNTCLYGATGGRLFVNGRAGMLLSSLETAFICLSILLIMQINCKPCCKVVFGMFISVIMHITRKRHCKLVSGSCCGCCSARQCISSPLQACSHLHARLE